MTEFEVDLLHACGARRGPALGRRGGPCCGSTSPGSGPPLRPGDGQGRGAARTRRRQPRAAAPPRRGRDRASGRRARPGRRRSAVVAAIDPADRHAHQRRRLRRRRAAVGRDDGARRGARPSAALYRVDHLGHDRADRHDHLERARLEPVRRRLLLHRQPDAARRRVRLRPGDGRPRGRRRFAAVEVEGAVPDGLAVDAEGGVWVALHGGWGLHRYAPDGELRRSSTSRSRASPAAASGAPTRATCT